MRLCSAGLSSPACLSRRFRLLDFLVRMCLSPCFLYFTFPLGVILKRLAVLRWVLFLVLIDYFFDFGVRIIDMKRPSICAERASIA